VRRNTVTVLVNDLRKVLVCRNTVYMIVSDLIRRNTFVVFVIDLVRRNTFVPLVNGLHLTVVRTVCSRRDVYLRHMESDET